MIKLYNTLSRKVEDFKPLDPNLVRLYTCGPTVYSYAHIGNLRSYILADSLYRTLKYNGYKVKWVMNITDIDDKTIKGAIGKFGPEAGVDELNKFTDKYFQAFLNDLKEVNVSVNDIEFVKVTDVIPQAQDFIVDLMNKGYAYKAEDGSTYFSIEKYQQDFGDYGKLVGEKFLEGRKIGARVKVDEYDKENLSDFALWKARDKADANIFWDHEVLGKGRPGWHIECSVINKVAFGGKPTDIHTGGVDLVFPHHTNEIAQSQPVYSPFVCHWFHSEHLLVDGKKMSKSLGNIYTLSDLKEKGFSGLDYRYFLLSAKYDTQQNFTWEGLKAAYQGLRSLADFITVAGFNKFMPESFNVNFDTLEIINKNLDFPSALAKTHKLINEAIVPWDEKMEAVANDFKMYGINMEELLKTEDVPADISELRDLRERARVEKDFAKSDELRKQMEDLGWEVMDTPEGQKLRKKV